MLSIESGLLNLLVCLFIHMCSVLESWLFSKLRLQYFRETRSILWLLILCVLVFNGQLEESVQASWILFCIHINMKAFTTITNIYYIFTYVDGGSFLSISYKIDCCIGSLLLCIYSLTSCLCGNEKALLCHDTVQSWTCILIYVKWIQGVFNSVYQSSLCIIQ